MKIDRNETVSELMVRLEREANERLTLLAALKAVAPYSTNGHSPISTSTKNEAPKKAGGAKPTLADHIMEVMREAGTPLTQPAIRDRLRERGVATEIKNPLSAIATAMTRKEGILFVRGDGFEWKLADLRRDSGVMPLINALNDEIPVAA